MDQETQKQISEEINKLPTESLKRKLAKIQLLNLEKIKLEEEGYEKEYEVLKSGYDMQYREIFAEISQLVKGDKIVEISNEEKVKYEIASQFPDSEKGIPQYWGTSIKNSEFLPVNEKDQEILKHLIDIRMKPVEGSKDDFILEFEFTPNDFFTHTILTKTYKFDPVTEEPEKSAGFNIEWTSQEKNPRIQVKTKKVKKGKTVETKKVESTVESFFDLFLESPDREDTHEEHNFWKEDFIPNSMEYYLNIVEPLEDDEEEEYEDEEEEEDEDDDDKAKKLKKVAKKPTEGAAAQGKDEKCKNQ